VGINNLWQQLCGGRYHRLSDDTLSSVGFVLLLFLGCGTNSLCVMGKLNVAVLRYLTNEDFRVLTAVGRNMINIIYVNFT